MRGKPLNFASHPCPFACRRVRANERNANFLASGNGNPPSFIAIAALDIVLAHFLDQCGAAHFQHGSRVGDYAVRIFQR